MKNYFWTFSNNFLVKGFSAVFFIILGNFLLPGELGVFVALKLVTDYVSRFAHFQFGAGVVYKLNDVTLAKERDNYFTAGFLSTLTSGILATLLLCLFVDFAVEKFQLYGYRNLLLFISPFVLFFLLTEYFNRVLQADLQFKIQTLVSASTTIFQIVACTAALVLGYKLFALFLCFYLGRLSRVILFGYYAFKKYKLAINNITIDALKSLLKFSSWIYLGAIAGFLDTRMDLFFINYYLSKKELAVYNYAVEIMLLFLIFGNSVSQVTFPKLSRAFSTSSPEANNIYSRSLNFSFLALSVLSLMLLFHAKYIISLVLPPVYLEMIPCLTILVLGIVLFASFASVGTIFTSKGIPGYGAFALWFSLSINFVLNIILIPPYGLIGAAIATTSSFVLRVIIGMGLIEYKIKTDYNYFRLICFYVLLIWVVLTGNYIIGSLFIKEILILCFMGLGFLFLLNDHDREHLRSFFPGLVYAKDNLSQ